MTPGRSNGLPAVRYSPLVDLEPHFADALLEALRDEGVAAYAAPAPGRRGPYLDIQLPDRPTDRVWVDAEGMNRAREVLRQRMPEFSETVLGPSRAPTLTQAESDAAWQAIVAGFDKTTSEPVPPWPVAEDAPADEPADHGLSVVAVWPEAANLAPAPAPVEPEEHFVPPPPPPLPRIQARTKLAWLGVACLPVDLVLRGWLGWYLFYGDEVLALGAFIGGASALIYRMRDDHHGSGPDDGAVV
ncbi:MAG TPA: hypothetical protein VHV82_07190 [Sporichthyaceae bacterium]|jgi:hypothetical protein|nr:hypothetical protein [Sporichthyaceae bacterium]